MARTGRLLPLLMTLGLAAGSCGPPDDGGPSGIGASGSGTAAARSGEDRTGAEPREARIERLVAQLGDTEYRVREQASSELRAMGFPIFARLRQAVRSTDAEVAVRAAAIIGDYDRIMELLDRLPSDWHETLYYSGLTETQRELAALGATAVPYLRDRLAREERRLYRFNCVTILNEVRSPEALAALRGLAADKDRWCRTEAVWALGNARDAEGLAIMAGALKDSEETVRREALVALGKTAGIRILGLIPDGWFEYSSDSYATEELRAELDRVVRFYLEHKKLPAAEQFKNERDVMVLPRRGRQIWNGPDLGNSEQLKGDWKVKSFVPPDGEGLWIFVRFEKSPLEDGDQKDRGTPHGDE